MRHLILCLLTCWLAAMALPAQGKVFLTTDEALALAFPKAKVERTKHVLDAKKKQVIAFGEPLDYLPRGSFYEQFLGRGLTDKLTTKGNVRRVVGATLTVNATVAAVRRILATHQLVFPKQVPKVAKKSGDGKTKPKTKPNTLTRTS